MFTNAKHPYAKALIDSLPSLKNKGAFRVFQGWLQHCYACPLVAPFIPVVSYGMEICQDAAPRHLNPRRIASSHAICTQSFQIQSEDHD